MYNMAPAAGRAVGSSAAAAWPPGQPLAGVGWGAPPEAIPCSEAFPPRPPQPPHRRTWAATTAPAVSPPGPCWRTSWWRERPDSDLSSLPRRRGSRRRPGSKLPLALPVCLPGDEGQQFYQFFSL